MHDPMSPAVRRGQVDDRLASIRAECRSRGAAAALLTTRANVAWATVGGQHHVVTASATGVAGLLVGPERAWLVAPSIEAERLVAEEIPGLGIDMATYPWWHVDGLARTTDRLLDGGLLLDDTDLEPELRAARSILTAADQGRLASLGSVAQLAVADTLAGIVPDQTEDDLAAALLGRLVGVRSPVVLVAADERIERYRHPLPGATPIRGRVMLVLVAEAWGLHVALTRFRELAAPPGRIVDRIRAVAEIQAAMSAATVPGATLGDVFEAARAGYAAAGWPDEWRDHHQGGTIAYQGREIVATPGDPTVIEPGMAFAWNPSIAGAKAEDTFVIAPDGSRRFVTVSP